MEDWIFYFGLYVNLAQFGSACLLHAYGSYQPWLIRIVLQNTHTPVTVAHGSLVSSDKVLTAANIESDMAKAGVDHTKPLNNSVLMVAYNSKQDCNLTRFAARIDFHRMYDSKKYQYCRLGEFALITTRESFTTIGAPFLIPSASYLTFDGKIEKLFNEFNAGNNSKTQEISVYVFSDKNIESGNIENGTVPYVPWTICTEMDSFKKIVGTRDPNATAGSFFCSETMPGESGAMASNRGFGYNWYQGAPVFFNNVSSSQNSTPSAGSAGYNMAIGQFLFWTGETGVPFVFATYTHYFVDFIMDSIPQYNKNESTEPHPTFPASRPTILTNKFRQRTRQQLPTFPSELIPTGGHPCHSITWIFIIGIVSFNVSL